MDSIQKRVPFSVDAEQALIGSVLIDPNCYDDIAQIIHSDDFYIEEHRAIFDCMSKFNLDSKDIELVTLINYLVSTGVYENEKDANAYIKMILDMTPSSKNARDYAKIVHDKSVLRKLIDASDEIQKAAYTESDEDVSKIVDMAEQKIYEIAGNNDRRDFQKIVDVVRRDYEYLQMLEKEGETEELLGVRSGFSGIDKYIVGFGKSDLIIVGARPGVGKTSFVLNIGTNIAKRTKKTVAVFSLEMSSDQLVMRMLSSEALVDSYKLRTGKFEKDDWDKIAGAAASLSETNIVIDDTTGVSVTSMKAKLRRVKNLGLVIVDYLQLMQTEKRRSDGSRVNEIAEISRGLKIMAKELNVPVIVCSQLSRSTEKENKRPMLSDLRDSGSIEQDADMVIFLSRDYYGNDPEKANLVDVIIAKNRHGGQGTVQMSWLAQYTKFMTLEEENNYGRDE